MPATPLTKQSGFDQLVNDLYMQSGKDYNLTDDDRRSINDNYHGDYRKFMSDFYKQAGITHQLSENDFKSVADHYGFDNTVNTQSDNSGITQHTGEFIPDVKVPENKGLSFARSDNSFSPSLRAIDTIDQTMKNYGQLKAEQSQDIDWMSQSIREQKNKIGDEIKRAGDIGDQNAINYVKNIFLPKNKERPIVDYEGDNKFTPTSEQTEPLWADYKKFQHAEDLLKQAKEYRDEPTKNNLSALWKGLTSPLAKDLLSGGLQEMERNLSVAGSTLTGNSETDKQLISAYKALKEIQSNPNINPSFLYQTGETISNMIPYIMQFALTRGSGTAVKGMTNQLLKTGTEKTLSNLVKKGTAYTAGALGQAMTMPMTASQFGEEVSQGKSLGNAFYQAVMKTTGETFGENFGEVGQKLLTKTLGKNSGKIRSAFQQAIGWNGPWEYIEENVTNAWNAALTDERQWKDFWDWKEQGLIALSTSIVGAPMALQDRYAKKRVTDKYRQSEDRLNNLGEGISSSVQSLINDESPDKTLTNLYRFMTEKGITDKQAIKDIFDYTQNRFRYNSMFKQEGESDSSATPSPEQQIRPAQQNQSVVKPSREQIRLSLIQQEKDYLDKITHREKGQILAATDDQGNPLYVVSGDRGDLSAMLTVFRETKDKNGQITLVPDVIHESKVLNPQIVNKEGELKKRIQTINDQFPAEQPSNVEEGETLNYQGKDYAVIEDQGDQLLLVDRANNEIKVRKAELSQPFQKTQQAPQPDVRPVTIGKHQFNVVEKQPGSGVYTLDQSFHNEQEAEKAKKEIEKNLGSKLSVSISKQDSGDPFTPDSYTIALNPIKNTSSVPVEPETTSKAPVNPELKAQVEQDMTSSYSFNGKEVDREYAETAVELARSINDLSGLRYKNDPGLQAMIEKKFPAPVQRYLVRKKEVSRSKATAYIDLAKTVKQLQELQVENDPETIIAYNNKMAELVSAKQTAPAGENTQEETGNEQPFEQDIPIENEQQPEIDLTNKDNAYSILTGKQELTDYDRSISRSIPDEVTRKINSGNTTEGELEGYRNVLFKGMSDNRTHAEISGKKMPKEITQSEENGNPNTARRLVSDPESINDVSQANLIALYFDMQNDLNKKGDQSIYNQITDDTQWLFNKIYYDGLNQEGQTIIDQHDEELDNFSKHQNQKLSVPQAQSTENTMLANTQQPESLQKNEISHKEPLKQAVQNDRTEQEENIPREGQREGSSEGWEVKYQPIKLRGKEWSFDGNINPQNGDLEFKTSDGDVIWVSKNAAKKTNQEVKTPLEKVLDKAEARNKIKDEEKRVNTSPTDAQKEAGNYQKGHVNIQGFDISIENPKGSMRSGVDSYGKRWEQKMNNAYGYFKRTQGKDGDQIDVFLGNDPASDDVFVVDQVNPDKSFDEHKILLGFSDIDQARKAYLSNYEEGWQGLGSITPTTIEAFKKWIGNGTRKRKPFSEYKEVQQVPDTNRSQQNLNQDETKSSGKGSETREGETIQGTDELTSDDRSGSGNLQREDDQEQSPALRRLNPGERSLVEMKYSLDRNFTFDGSTKIESTDDVAYLFRQLENRSVENMFTCLVKDGKPTIIHMSMGTRWATQADIGMIGDFIGRFSPDKIYLIHNHPSGNLTASKQDIDLHNRAVKAYGNIIGEHVIINGVSGKYATFRNGDYDHEIKERPEQVSEAKNYKVYNFDRRVFREDTDLPFQVKQPDDVAKFISAQRFTSGRKLSAIILDRSNAIHAYLHLPSVDFNDRDQVKKLIQDIQIYAARFGGSRIILSGNDINGMNVFNLNTLKGQLKQLEIDLLDFVSVKSELDYQSMANEGSLEPEEHYGKRQTLDEMLQSGSYIPDRIKINGIERPTRNSNNQLIHPTVVGIKNFWRWFSDSDKAKRIEKLRYSKPIEITGKEITPSDDLKEYKRNALEYGKSLKGEYVNQDMGKTISISGGSKSGGMREILHHDYKDIEHLQSIAAIPRIIENSIFIEKHENEDKTKHPDIKEYEYFVSGLKIGGVDHTVKSVISIDSKGNSYYDHRLTQIEKGKLLAALPVIQKTGAETSNSPLSSIKDKRLLEILQVKSSKVVDDQGKPLVVYHGTKAEFTEFKNGVGNSQGSYLAKDQSAFFFANKEVAENYGNGGLMDAYLFIQDPYTVDVSDELREIISGEGFEDANEAEEYGYPVSRWEGKGELSMEANDSATAWFDDHAQEIYENAIKEGKDGIIIYGADDSRLYVVFSPEQIKSATGNDGSFDPNTPVIVKEPGFDYKPVQEAILNDNGMLDQKLEAITAASQAYNHSTEVKVPWNETVDKMREFWSDENLPIRRWEEEILRRAGTQDDNSQTYRDMRNSFGRMEALYRGFQEDKIDPVKGSIVKMVKSGVDSDMVLPYTIAKHGLENNREMREKELQEWVKANPEASIFDVKAKEQELSNKDYSGLWPLDENKKYKEVDKLAQDIVDGFESLAKKEDIEEFWKNIKSATDFILDTWLAGGQIDKKQHEFHKNRFDYFVPLRGWREGAAKYLRYKNNEGGVGRSLKSREGRTSLPDNPLAYIQTVGFKAINEQVANEVKQAALELVISNFGGKFKDLHTIKQAYLVKRTEWNEDENRDEEVWVLYRDEQGNLVRPPKEMFDRDEVKTQVFDEHEKLRTKWNAAQHEVIVRKDGGFRVIVFPENQLSVAQALNGQNTMIEIFGKIIDARKLGDTMLFRFIGGVTNFMKGMMTSYNPVFPFTNFFRDQPEAAITQYIRQNSNIPQMAVEYTPTAAKAIIRHMTGKFDPNNIHDVELKNFLEFGGTTGFTHEKSIEKLEKEFKKELAKALRKDKLRGQTLDRAADALKYIEYWNRIFEDTTRYAVYLSAREKGLSIRDACFESRNASVDFNMKGKGTRMIEALFGFFKAGINAGQKNFQLAKRKPAKFASVAATVASLGFLEAMLNDWGGDDDEYYRVNDYVRQNYFVMRKFWGNEKEYLRVPLPQFWRGFHAMGVSVYDYLKGKSRIGEAVANTFSNMVAGMSPVDVTSFIQDGKWSWAPFWPTSVKPMMEVHVNRDFMNNPVYREAFTKTLEEQLAESGMNKKNVNKSIKFFTDMIFKATGGEGNLKFKINEKGKLVYLPDVTDWNPSQVEHLIKGYFGGVGRFGVDFVHTMTQVVSPQEEVDLNNVPFINSFIREVPEEKWQVMDRYNEIEKIVRDTDKYRQEAQKAGDKEKLERYRNSEYPGIKSVFERHDKIVDHIMKKYGFEDEKASAEIIKRMKMAVEDVEALEDKNKNQVRHDQAVMAE